ncbi:MAG TPA: fibronectin type III domain-containing protein [Vicinamibacterales bacterium]|nr:fibronectin type III domain-containing protein [Vicinamibacterales bacterium]
MCLALLCVTLLSASAHAATVTLQWDRNPEADVQGYVIRYGTQSGTYTAEVNVGNLVSYTLTLAPSTTTTYYFVVQAYNTSGLRSGNSAQVSTTVAATAASQNTLTVDRPGDNSVLLSDTLLAGWALDRAATSGTGVDAVHVYAYPNPGSGAAPVFLGVASYGGVRADVGAAYGSRFTNSGFSLPVVGLATGTYDFAFYARSTVTGTFNATQRRRVTISATPPITGGAAAIGLPAPNARVRTWLSVGGWAVDVRSTSGPGMDVVQVWAYPNPGSGETPLFLGNAQYGIDRADVATVFGNSRYRRSGFYMDVMSMPAGVFDIVALARSTVTRSWEVARVTRITVDPAVLITIDAPANFATVGSSFSLSGWALDRRATSNSGVDTLHIYAYPNPGSGVQPIWIGAVTPNRSRPDVAAVYGSRYAMSGFSVPVSGLAPGVYDIVIFAHSSVTNSFDNGRLVRITVQ